LTPRSGVEVQDGKKLDPDNVPDHNYESIVTVFGLKIRKNCCRSMPFLTWIRDGKIQIMDKHSGFNFRFKLSIVVDRHRFDEPDPSFYQMPI
jgi:hypothetical protein